MLVNVLSCGVCWFDSQVVAKNRLFDVQLQTKDALCIEPWADGCERGGS